MGMPDLSMRTVYTGTYTEQEQKAMTDIIEIIKYNITKYNLSFRAAIRLLNEAQVEIEKMSVI